MERMKLTVGRTEAKDEGTHKKRRSPEDEDVLKSNQYRES